MASRRAFVGGLALGVLLAAGAGFVMRESLVAGLMLLQPRQTMRAMDGIAEHARARQELIEGVLARALPIEGELRVQSRLEHGVLSLHGHGRHALPLDDPDALDAVQRDLVEALGDAGLRVAGTAKLPSFVPEVDAGPDHQGSLAIRYEGDADWHGRLDLQLMRRPGLVTFGAVEYRP